MIVAVTGTFLTGKTTIARELAERIRYPLRICGDEVRALADTLAVPLADLTDDAHREIDRATREWTLQHRHCIVDGQYLDRVLANLAADKVLVRLKASAEERRARSIERDGRAISLSELTKDDVAEAEFVRRLYADAQSMAAKLELDTTGLSVDACVQILKLSLTSL